MACPARDPKLPWHYFQARSVHVPAHDASLLEPIAKHDAFRHPAFEIHVVNGRPVRMPMQQNIDTALPECADNRVLVDVHDVFTHRVVIGLALLSCVLGERNAFFQRFGAHHRLPLGISSHKSNLLILCVVNAECVAVA